MLEGYLQSIPFKRIKISPSQKGEGIVFLEIGIFCKYPSHTWYIFLITPNIFKNLLFSILIVMHDIYSNEKNNIVLLYFPFFHTCMWLIYDFSLVSLFSIVVSFHVCFSFVFICSFSLSFFLDLHECYGHVGSSIL